jgi:hypothetical protein
MASDTDPLLMQGKSALQVLDKVLRDRPKKVGSDFSDAIARLSALRDEMIGRYRSAGLDAGESPELQQLNSVITLVIAGHYPLGKVPWSHVEQARERFATLLPELGNVPSGSSERNQEFRRRDQ